MLIAPHNSSVEAFICANLLGVRSRIAAAARGAGRTVESITVIAVSKGHGADQVRAAAANGCLHFGESYLQEALPKIESLRELPLIWHFIGRIQSNKSRSIAEGFDWVHGLDRLKVAERLSAQRPHYAAPLQVCLQVNIAAESTKAGVACDLALELVQAVRQLPRLQLRGLMCILPADRGPEHNRQSFQAMSRLLQQINDRTGAGLDTLSMGMSDDFADAILEGATLLRIGTAIFGTRAEMPSG